MADCFIEFPLQKVAAGFREIIRPYNHLGDKGVAAGVAMTVLVQKLLPAPQAAVTDTESVILQSMLLVLTYGNRGIFIAMVNTIEFCQRIAAVAVHVVEAIAGGQEVGQVALVIIEGEVLTAALGALEHAAGNLHRAVSHLLHRGRIGAAGDGQGVAGIGVEAHSRAAEIGAFSVEVLIGDAAAADGVGQGEAGMISDDQRVARMAGVQGMAVPVDGEVTILDVDLLALGQGDIPQQGQGGAVLAHGVVHGVIDGGKIGDLRIRRHAGHDGIAAGAGVAVGLGGGVLGVGNHIDILRAIRGGARVGVHQLGTGLVIGQGIALGQQVNQVTRLAGQSRRSSRSDAFFKYAAGNLHAALRGLDDGGIVGSALDGELAAVADGRARALVSDSITASAVAGKGDIGIAGDNQNRRCAAGRPH